MASVVIDLHEREVRLFPRSNVVDPIGRSLILPETRNLNAIDMRDVGDGIQLRATGLIGYLPLTSQITLNIHPKFPLDNLWFMLEQADEGFERILPVIRNYQNSNESAPHQLLARSFCYFLMKIMSSGVARDYHAKTETGFFKSKVNFGATISKYVSRGNHLNTISDTFNFSQDIYPNRILKAGCILFSRLVPRHEKWLAERAVLDDALAVFTNVQPHYISKQDLGAAARTPMRIRGYFAGALEAYAILAGHTGVGFSYQATGSLLPSFLFRLDDVFENFVRNVCQKGLIRHGLSVVDGNKSKHYGALFRDNKTYPTKPDMIFRRKKHQLFIGEIKYKPKIEESDRYQLISHVTAHGCNFGFWVSPSSDSENASMEYVGSINSGAKFYHYKIDLASDLIDQSDKMVESIAGLLGKI